MFSGLPGGSDGGGETGTVALIVAALVPLIVFGSLMYYAMAAF